MSRPYYTYYKRGNLKYKHLQLIHDYDPIEWGHTEKQEAAHFSEFMTTCNVVIRHDREDKEFYRSKLKPIGTKIDSIGEIIPEFETGLMLDDTKLAVVTQDVGLPIKLKDGSNLGIIDCVDRQNITKLIIGPESFDDAEDIHLISSGLHTHGTAGDFADIIALKADLDTLIGTLTARTISTQILNAACLFTTDFGGELFKIDSDTPHGGNPTVGWIIKSNTNNHMLQTTGATAGTFEVEGISVERIAAGSNDLHGLIVCQMNSTAHLIHDVFFNGGNLRGTGFWHGNNSNNILSALAIRNCDNWGLYDFLGNGVHTHKNILVHGCGIGVDVNVQTATYINVASGLNTSNWVDVGNATGDFTMSSGLDNENADWGTGTNNISEVTLADEFELNPALATYARQKIASSASTADPSLSLMDGTWTDEIGPKVREAAAGGIVSPYYYQKFLAGM